MTCTISHTITHQTTRQVVEKQPLTKYIDVENVHIEKEVVNTQKIIEERINYVYSSHNRTIYQPVNNLGTIIDTIA